MDDGGTEGGKEVFKGQTVLLPSHILSAQTKQGKSYHYPLPRILCTEKIQ